MDDETIESIFQGVLEDLPRPTSKVNTEIILDIVFTGLWSEHIT